MDGTLKSSAEFAGALNCLHFFFCSLSLALFLFSFSLCQFTDAENKRVSRTRGIITLRSKKRENSCISSSHFRGLTAGVSSDTSVSEKDGN